MKWRREEKNGERVERKCGGKGQKIISPKYKTKVVLDLTTLTEIHRKRGEEQKSKNTKNKKN